MNSKIMVCEFACICPLLPSFMEALKIISLTTMIAVKTRVESSVKGQNRFGATLKSLSLKNCYLWLPWQHSVNAHLKGFVSIWPDSDSLGGKGTLCRVLAENNIRSLGKELLERVKEGQEEEKKGEGGGESSSWRLPWRNRIYRFTSGKKNRDMSGNKDWKWIIVSSRVEVIVSLYKNTFLMKWEG